MEALILYSVVVFGIAGFVLYTVSKGSWCRNRAEIRSGLTLGCILLAVGAGLLVGAVLAGRDQASREQQFATEMAPVINGLREFGVHAPRGLELSDPSLYEFADNSGQYGMVWIINRQGRPIKVQFRLTDLGLRIGCVVGDRGFQPIETAVLLSTEGCAGS